MAVLAGLSKCFFQWHNKIKNIDDRTLGLVSHLICYVISFYLKLSQLLFLPADAWRKRVQSFNFRNFDSSVQKIKILSLHHFASNRCSFYVPRIHCQCQIIIWWKLLIFLFIKSFGVALFPDPDGAELTIGFGKSYPHVSCWFSPAGRNQDPNHDSIPLSFHNIYPYPLGKPRKNTRIGKISGKFNSQ